MQRTVRVSGETIVYELLKTSRRSVEIRVLPTGIRVFAPSTYPLRQADAFVAERADWIREAKARLNRYADRELDKFPMTDGMLVPVEGHPFPLKLVYGSAAPVRFDEGRIVITGRDLSPEAVKEALRGWLIDLAHVRIEERLEHYIPLIGRAPNAVHIREQRTKWGSCSSRNNLNFNWKLIMAPPEALDYVVIHELCHLYEFNHSDRFWARVARYQSDYAVWRDFLRSGWAHPFS